MWMDLYLVRSMVVTPSGVTVFEEKYLVRVTRVRLEFGVLVWDLSRVSLVQCWEDMSLVVECEGVG